MDETTFWAIIDASEPADEDGQADRLQRLLAGRSREELEAFDLAYRRLLRRAYRWDLWGAGYQLCGGMSDDGFDYFRDWLIGRGRALYEQALADPDSLADVEEAIDNPGQEELRYAVQRAYESTHGERMPYGSKLGPLGDPEGEPWEEDDLPRLFPRISAAVPW